MAQRNFRIDLLDTVFPMLSEQLGRTVIGSTREEISTKENHPKVYYMHNVMPSAYGLDSVGYQAAVPAITPADNTLLDTRPIYGDAKTRMMLAWNDTGEVYVLKCSVGIWTKLPATVPATTSPSFDINSVTIGRVNGVSYIFYAGIGCFVYNEITDELDHTVLTGLSIADILGVTSSSGYLIAYTAEAVAWSSTIDPTDFTPSQVTGAGGGNVAGIDGAIKFMLPNSLGLVVYTDTNAIGITYTGNLRYPFKFREISNSKGGTTLDAAAYEANASAQFVYSKAGLQLVDSQKAETILPQVTDFLAGKRLEDFDEVTSTFSVTDLTTTMKKKVKFIASRYLVISYGIDSFTHAIVYDITLDKLGKLKVDHVDCYECISLQVEVSKESIAFMSSDGSVQYLDFATSAASEGVCLLGKLQYTRSRMLTLQEVESENIEAGVDCTVSSLYSFDGKTLTKVDGTLAHTANNVRKHVFHITALNHSLLYVGKFNLTSVLVTYTAGGRR